MSTTVWTVKERGYVERGLSNKAIKELTGRTCKDINRMRTRIKHLSKLANQKTQSEKRAMSARIAYKGSNKASEAAKKAHATRKANLHTKPENTPVGSRLKELFNDEPLVRVKPEVLAKKLAESQKEMIEEKMREAADKLQFKGVVDAFKAEPLPEVEITEVPKVTHIPIIVNNVELLIDTRVKNIVVGPEGINIKY